MRKIILLILFCVYSISSKQLAHPIAFNVNLLNDLDCYIQADSIVKEMTIDEKIGQLFMVAVQPSIGENHLNKIEEQIQEYHIGGIIFFKGNPTQQILTTNRYQKLSKIPLFVAMDAEWGVSMRLDSIIDFPRQMTMGAIQDESMIYQMGRSVADQCKRLGVHINFAPVVDINVNANNPVIHTRSFGENKENVAKKGYAYMKGLQDNGIMAVAKHFPGHGDTDKDSHKDLPTINHSKKRLEEVELYPFRYLVNKGVDGVMIAHLNIPKLTSSSNLPSTLSSEIVTGLLKEELNFGGLVFTDALNMKGVAANFKAGEIELKAFKAGNDILLFPQDISKAFAELKQALNSGEIAETDLDKKVKKIIANKIKYGDFDFKPLNTKHIVEDINTNEAKFLIQKLAEKSLVLVRNTDDLIPIKQLSNKKIASIAIGPMNENQFQKTLKLYTEIKTFQITNFENKKNLDLYYDSLKEYNMFIFSTHNISLYNVSTFGLSDNIIDFINKFEDSSNCVLVNFGSPYALKKFQNFKGILQANENMEIMQHSAAQSIFGGIPINGKLQVSINKNISEGDGIKILKPIRLKYTIPIELNIKEKDLKKIDSIVVHAINEGAIPGCQVLVAKDGKVFYAKSFGYQTYKNNTPINNNNIYDLASVTKITATLPAIMKLYETNKLSLEDSVNKYFDDKSKYNYSNSTIRELLLHEAGFKAWIAFYFQTMENSKLKKEYYRSVEEDGFNIKVSNNLYIINSINDTIWKIINETKTNPKGKYEYSDLDFIFLKRIVETLTNEPFEDYLNRNYYSKIGMNNTMFNPIGKIDTSLVPPTENDNYFRGMEIRGYVHDPGAAMLGGIQGHAGLFSNSNDLAKYLYMLLNNGEYGGEKYFNASTIELFSTCQSNNSRRGLGFDKPEPNSNKGPTSSNTPLSTFGHTGFTGTCVWADPENDLIYIFLSNRTYPNSANRKLLQLNTRTEIQRVIYEAISLDSTK